MKHGLYQLALAGILSLSLASQASDILDTPDQRQLDALAVKLHQQGPYDDLIMEARQQFSSVAENRGYDTESPILKRSLDTAIEELAFSAMQKAVNDDPAHPMVYSVLNPPRASVPGGRYAYDNPDAIYRTIPIDAEYGYIVRGRRAKCGLSDASFSLITNLTQTTAISVLANEDLVINQDGSFVITINSTAATYPNHIQSDSRAVQLFIRNNIADWSSETPDSLTVEITSTKNLPRRLSDDEIVEKARVYFKESIPVYGSFLLGDQTLKKPQNVIIAPVQSSTFGTLATQASSFSHYNLSSTEALVITINPGPASYWVLPSYTLWMITDRPRDRLESLNMNQAVANKNGTFTVVLSTADPGVHNWINATEGGIGTFMCRFQGLPVSDEGGSQIQLWSQVVPMERLSRVLPKGTKRVTKKEREHYMRERESSYDRLRGF
ncbi:hypothetical protein FDECE_309 [Fusarium decemcellulare]|nr:hypothetical protein FDECE_309 [Fusarium decemcellulare]